MSSARPHADPLPSATRAAAANAAMSAAASPRCRAPRTPPTAIAATPVTHTTAANATTQIAPAPDPSRMTTAWPPTATTPAQHHLRFTHPDAEPLPC